MVDYLWLCTPKLPNGCAVGSRKRDPTKYWVVDIPSYTIRHDMLCPHLTVTCIKSALNRHVVRPTHSHQPEEHRDHVHHFRTVSHRTSLEASLAASPPQGQCTRCGAVTTAGTNAPRASGDWERGIFLQSNGRGCPFRHCRLGPPTRVAQYQ